MGQRANLILIQNDRDYELYYSHWAANTLDLNLFWGPKHAITYIQSQQKVEKDEWLDNAWAEGGVVLDPDRKVLLWYGGEATLDETRYRNSFLQLMRIPWKGWDLRWAYNEMVDLADYVGHPREAVLSGPFHHETRAFLDPQKDGKTAHMFILLSVLDEAGNTRLIPLLNSIPNYLSSGPAFLDKLDQIPAMDRLSVDHRKATWYEETMPDTCVGGIHLNMPGKKIDYWGKYLHYGDVEYIAALWPEWQVTKHYDEYEWQELATNNAFQLIFDTEEDFLKEITDNLLRNTRESSVELFLKSMHNTTQEAKKVTINPDVFSDTPFELADSERWRIWAIAVEELYGFEEMDRQKNAFLQRQEESRKIQASIQSKFKAQESVQTEWAEESTEEVSGRVYENADIAVQLILAIIIAGIIFLLIGR